MHMIENTFQADSKIPKIFSLYFHGFRSAALDIETTGLSSERAAIILIGVMTYENHGYKITQFFADSPSEEPKLLSAFLSYITPFDVLFNYNGTSFDIPFINKRCEKFGLTSCIPLCKSFDLYRIVKSSFLPSILPDLKLKTVEKLAGVQRRDQISGKDSVALYKKYSVSGDKSLAKQILLHNYEDLACFTSLFGLMKKINFHQAIHNHGFPVKSKHFILYIKSIKQNAHHLFVKGQVPSAEMDYTYYLNEFTLLIDASTKEFTLEVYDVEQISTVQDVRDINMQIMNYLKFL